MCNLQVHQVLLGLESGSGLELGSELELELGLGLELELGSVLRHHHRHRRHHRHRLRVFFHHHLFLTRLKFCYLPELVSHCVLRILVLDQCQAAL